MGSMCCPHMDGRVSRGRWTGPVVNGVVNPMMLHGTKPHFRDRIARQPHLHVSMQDSTTCTHRSELEQQCCHADITAAVGPHPFCLHSYGVRAGAIQVLPASDHVLSVDISEFSVHTSHAACRCSQPTSVTSRRIAFCSSAPEAIKVESQSTRAKLQKLPPVKAQLPPVLASWSTDQSFFLPASDLQRLHATREPLAVASRVDRLLHSVQAPRQKSMTGSGFILTVFYGPRRVVLANLPAAQSPAAMCDAMRDGAVREGTPEGLGRLGQLSPGISASLQNPPRGLGVRSYSMQATPD